MMSTNLLAKADTTGTLEAPLRRELVEATRDYMAEARAQTTRRAYSRAWAAFEAWCHAEGRQALPASPGVPARWCIKHLAQCETFSRSNGFQGFMRGVSHLS
jgi:hypothetical protein